MSEITKIGTEPRIITTSYSIIERDTMARDLAGKVGELDSLSNQINELYKQREKEVIALEALKKPLDSQIKRLQTAVITGQVTETIQCDVYNDGINKIVIKPGFEPTDAAGILEITPLETTEQEVE